jgi:hypothetical protein
MGVMPTVAKHFAFPVIHEDEILRLLPHQNDVATQSLAGGFQTRPYTLFAVAPAGDQPVAPTPFNLLLFAICHLAYTLCAACSLLSYCSCVKNPFRSSSVMMLLSMNSEGFLFLNRGSVKATLSSSN